MEYAIFFLFLANLQSTLQYDITMLLFFFGTESCLQLQLRGIFIVFVFCGIKTKRNDNKITLQ
jgi:hypothetical protein